VGPAPATPEPVAEFFDAMVVAMEKRPWLSSRTHGSRGRSPVPATARPSQRWSAIQGVYIPAFFEARFDASGFQAVVPIYKDYAAVRRAMVADLDAAPFRIGR